MPGEDATAYIDVEVTSSSDAAAAEDCAPVDARVKFKLPEGQSFDHLPQDEGTVIDPDNHVNDERYARLSAHNNRVLTSTSGLTKDQIEHVGVLISDSQIGRFTPNLESPEKIRRYVAHYRPAMQWALCIVFIIFLAIIIFESPNGQLGTELSPSVTLPIEFACLGFFCYRVWDYYHIVPHSQFWREGKVVVIVVALVLSILDIIVFGIMHSQNAKYDRLGRVLRPLFVINLSTSRLIRQGFRSVRKTVRKVLDVLALLIITIWIFTILFVKMYGNRHDIVDKNGERYMNRYDDTWWNLYVLITTANFPDIMMPAYDVSAWYSILFIVFLLLGLYVFMSILLAVVYENYRKCMREEMRTLHIQRRRNLHIAFSMIMDEEKKMVTFATFSKIIHHLYPRYTRSRQWLLWVCLDENSDGEIDQQQFLQIGDILNISVYSLSAKTNFFDRWIPDIYNSQSSEAFKAMVNSKKFEYFFDFLIVLTIVFIVLDERRVDAFFVVAFVVECISKIYANGFTVYFRNGWNRFDFVIAFGALAASLAAALHKNGPYVEIILALRIFRLVRVLQAYSGFKTIIVTILNIGPAIYTYGTMVILVYYMYAVVGMFFFAGLICTPSTELSGSLFSKNSEYYNRVHACNAKINTTEFAEDGYYMNNFNDPVSSFVTLFELMVVNQWHVIVAGFVTLTSNWARLYFWTFHVIMVSIILNIFIAFVIEAFVLQLELEKSVLEDRLLQNLENELDKCNSTSMMASEYERTSIKATRKMQVLIEQLFTEDDYEHHDRPASRKSSQSDQDREIILSSEIRNASDV